MSDYQLSQRRFWALVGTDRNMVRRERPLDHFTSREKMHEIAARRRRFVYQRVGVMLECKGHMNHQKL